jgi:hypothetical protein
VRLWDVAIASRAGLLIQLFANEGWCALETDGRPLNGGGEAWRWLRWRRTDASTGTSTLLPAEYFGALPGIPAPV